MDRKFMAEKASRPQMTMGDFRELTEGVPDEWPVELAVRQGDNDFTFVPADASVDLTNHVVVISDDTHIQRPG